MRLISMNLRAFVIVLGCIVLGLAVAFVLMPGTEETPTAAAAAPLSAPHSADTRNAEPAPTYGSPQRSPTSPAAPDSGNHPANAVTSDGRISLYSAEDFERFIKQKGEAPGTLAVAFELSNDVRWLNRALEIAPDSPLALVTAITDNPDASAETRLAWIERLKAIDPKNPGGWILRASMLTENEPKTEFFAELADGLQRPAFYTYAKERTEACRAFFESIGMSPVEAEFKALVALRLPFLAPAMAINKELEKIKIADGTDAATIAEATRIQYMLGKMFQKREASQTLVSQMAGFTLELKGIAAIPPREQEPRKAEIEALKKKTSHYVVLVTRMRDGADEKRVEEYVRRVRSDGELAAMTWLESLEKK